MWNTKPSASWSSGGWQTVCILTGTVLTAFYLYDVWLPTSGETSGDFPIFFHYVNVGPQVQEHEMITDVYLPLR